VRAPSTPSRELEGAGQALRDQPKGRRQVEYSVAQEIVPKGADHHFRSRGLSMRFRASLRWSTTRSTPEHLLAPPMSRALGLSGCRIAESKRFESREGGWVSGFPESLEVLMG
jgi:hypothetical protein